MGIGTKLETLLGSMKKLSANHTKLKKLPIKSPLLDFKHHSPHSELSEKTRSKNEVSKTRERTDKQEITKLKTQHFPKVTASSKPVCGSVIPKALDKLTGSCETNKRVKNSRDRDQNKRKRRPSNKEDSNCAMKMIPHPTRKDDAQFRSGGF